MPTFLATAMGVHSIVNWFLACNIAIEPSILFNIGRPSQAAISRTISQVMPVAELDTSLVKNKYPSFHSWRSTTRGSMERMNNGLADSITALFLESSGRITLVECTCESGNNF